ncbi:RNA polymerase sigma-70 factor [uncultured Sunxiuqinia sp.]|uniref:RNA polymerase sigma-70 factor n=1 Tax=uncultured Sunxiuqinia sp. TaxID=1573825 RepID=UPI00260843F3|nr:RNA polymerase sigma-70 factor [uncultured Sunxiuqinia sp.]
MSDFDTLFKNYHHSLFVYALKFVADEEVALDLVQDVFTLIWEKKKLKLDDEHLKAYLFRSIRNACLNYLKHQQVVSQYQQFQGIKEMELLYYRDGEQSLIEKENLDRIYQAIHSLSDIHREVIELSRFEGLKNKEIAEALNVPLRTVETRLFRALSALREKLSEKLFHIFLNFCCLKNKVKKLSN